MVLPDEPEVKGIPDHGGRFGQAAGDAVQESAFGAGEIEARAR
jgi:hypothetical protein